jgi:hypothetical protein
MNADKVKKNSRSINNAAVEEEEEKPIIIETEMLSLLLKSTGVLKASFSGKGVQFPLAVID